MVLKRRIRLLGLGILGSVCAAAALIFSCGQMTKIPVAAVSMEFPMALEGTPLTLIGITGYEGPYVEDGSDEEVVDIAAITLLNTGEDMIDSARILLRTEQEDMYFSLTQLPPGEKAILLERSGKIWAGQPIVDCMGEVTQSPREDLQIRVNISAEGLLEISNPTDKPVKGLLIMHKTFSESFDAYLGGITYETGIEEIQPGQLLIVRPSHFAPGISRIVKIKTGEGHCPSRDINPCLIMQWSL